MQKVSIKQIGMARYGIAYMTRPSFYNRLGCSGSDAPIGRRSYANTSKLKQHSICPGRLLCTSVPRNAAGKARAGQGQQASQQTSGLQQAGR